MTTSKLCDTSLLFGNFSRTRLEIEQNYYLGSSFFDTNKRTREDRLESSPNRSVCGQCLNDDDRWRESQGQPFERAQFVCTARRSALRIALSKICVMRITRATLLLLDRRERDAIALGKGHVDPLEAVDCVLRSCGNKNVFNSAAFAIFHYPHNNRNN